MADIIVDPSKLKGYAQRLSGVNNRITRLDRRLDLLYRKVGLLGLWNLICADALTGYSWRISRCRTYLQQTAADFEAVEKLLSSMDPSKFQSRPVPVQTPTGPSLPKYWTPQRIAEQRTIRSQLMPMTIGFGIAQSALALLTSPGWESFWRGDFSYTDRPSVFPKEKGDNFYGIHNTEGTVSVKPEFWSLKNKDIIGDKDHLNINIDQTKVKKKDMLVNPDEKWYGDPSQTILEGKIEEKLEGNVIKGHLEGETAISSGSVTARGITGEMHAEAAAGLYVFVKDSDGKTKKVFAPSVSAEVGASAAVVQVEAEGRIGLGEDKNMLGLYGNVDAEALSVGAKGEVRLNADEQYMGVSAEANLVKVSAAGGVSVLGADIGVTGSFKIGVGVHAEAGYTDGKFKVDVGAAFGVGFDVGFEIDVEGTVDAVCDLATSAWDGATDMISNAWEEATGFWGSIFR